LEISLWSEATRSKAARKEEADGVTGYGEASEVREGCDSARSA
jgi:hypothetical protein